MSLCNVLPITFEHAKSLLNIDNQEEPRYGKEHHWTRLDVHRAEFDQELPDEEAGGQGGRGRRSPV